MVRGNAMTIRLDDEERDALDRAAEQEGVPASIFIREAIRNEIKRRQELRKAMERAQDQGIYQTADGSRYHWYFMPESKVVLVAGPLLEGGAAKSDTIPAGSREEAKASVTKRLGQGDFK